MIVVVIFFNFINLTLPALILIGVKEVHVEKLVQCPGKNTSLVLDNALLNYQKTVMNINAQFTFNQPIGGKIDMIIELTKCQIKGEDTCEFNSRHRVILDCKQLHAKNKMWSEFVEHIQGLPDKCPITAGTYNMTDAQFSLNHMERLPLQVGYWKMSSNGYQRKQLIFCIEAEVDIQMQRKRKFG